VKKSDQYLEFRENLIKAILNKESCEEESFLNTKPETNELASSETSQAGSGVSSKDSTTESSFSNSDYSYEDFDKSISEKTDNGTEESNSFEDESPGFYNELIEYFDNCDELENLEKIAGLYSDFCAHLELASNSSYIPDSKIFLEWFLIKQLDLEKRSRKSRKKSSIYAY
jgi:hypothetical protein